jgi:hypothetical protein
VPLSEATITHLFNNADRTPGSGQVEFSLTKRVTNGSISLVPSTITASLNASGELSQKLTANNDAGTVPGDSQWRVDFRILGASAETFYIVVPTGGGTVDLGSLLPKQPQGG